MNAFETYQSIARNQSQAAAQRLFQTYQMAIEANVLRNTDTVKYCLDLLRHTLDFQSDPMIAHNLLLIYRDCELALNEGKHDAVGEILETVSGLWKARLKLEEMAAAE